MVSSVERERRTASSVREKGRGREKKTVAKRSHCLARRANENNSFEALVPHDTILLREKNQCAFSGLLAVEILFAAKQKHADADDETEKKRNQKTPTTYGPQTRPGPPSRAPRRRRGRRISAGARSAGRRGPQACRGRRNRPPFFWLEFERERESCFFFLFFAGTDSDSRPH